MRTLANSAHSPLDEATRALDHLRRIVQALRESSRASESALGVSGAQLFVLQALAENEPMALNEVAERTRTHQSSVSVVVKRLVERGLVLRRPAASDARRLELSLSARGRALAARGPTLAHDRLQNAMSSLSAREVASLARTLGKLAGAMALPTGAPAMFFEEGKAHRSGRAG